MNGIHDVGGMDGFGPVVREENEPPFHEPWEGRMRAIHQLAMRKLRAYHLDESRHYVERIHPVYYMAGSYYQLWLVRMEVLLIERGLLTEEEIRAKTAELSPGGVPSSPLLPYRQVLTPIRSEQRTFVHGSINAGNQRVGGAEQGRKGGTEEHGAGGAAAYRQGGTDAEERPDTKRTERQRQGGAHAEDRADAEQPRFSPGMTVRVKMMSPLGHTRAPRYTRGKCGVVEKINGRFVLPDMKVSDNVDLYRTVYLVRFAARELWGEEASPKDKVYIEMWEDYLEPGGDPLEHQ